MGRRSSVSGWASRLPPGTGPPHLFATFCDSCAVSSLCGEIGTSTACGRPEDYDPEDLHPSRDMVAAAAAELGQPISARPRAFTSGLVIAKAFVPSEGGAIAIHADRLVSTSIRRVDDGIAVLLGNDQHLMNLWKRRSHLGLWLKDAGCGTVISPGFSMYWESSSFDGLLSMRMASEMARLLSRYVNVIPTIGWRTNRDLERWIEWINSGEVPALAVHFSTGKCREWDWMLEGVDLLAKGVPTTTRLIAAGVSGRLRVQRIAATWPGPLTIASGKPWLAAKHGCLLLPNLRVKRVSRRVTTEILVQRNVATFLAATSELISRPTFHFAS
jgi:hypothetical protein